MSRILVKRVYDSIDKDDGMRVLVDGLWPRGIAKEQLKADHWMREAAPSGQLRKWFGHDPARWGEFKRRYHAELKAKPEISASLLEMAREKGVTLLYSARDVEHNQAVALREYLQSVQNC